MPPEKWTPKWKPTTAPKSKSVFDPGIVEGFMQQHPIIRRMLGGPDPETWSQEEVDKYKSDPQFARSGIKVGDTKQVIGTPTSDSLLPEAKHPEGESFPGFMVRGLYNQLIRPLGSPEGFVGSLIPGKVNALEGEVLPAVESFQKQLPLRQVTQPKLLGPAVNPQEIPKPITKPSYFAGRAGVVPNKPIQNDMGGFNPALGNRETGTILNREVEGVSPVNPILAAEHGVGQGMGTPKIVPPVPRELPQIYRPRTVKELSEEQIQRIIGKSKNSLPSAPPKGPVSRLRPTVETPPNPNRNMGAGVKTITNPSGRAAQKILADVKPVNATPIAANLTPKEAVKNWTNGRNAAEIHANNARKQFANLSDPKLIDQFQAGVRTPELNKVQQYLDSLFNQEQKAGLLGDEKYRENYLRQYWDNTPEEIAKAYDKQGINFKNPSFGKQRFFETYQQGIAAGLKPKYNNIADIVAARTAESKVALKNKEFFDYLKATKQLKSGDVGEPTNWIFQGNNADELAKYTKNYLGKGWEGTKKVADISSASKNIQLAGGIPGTKYNIHGWNTMWSDAKLRGYMPAFKEFLTDPTGKKALAEFEGTANQSLLAKAVENGYVHHPVEDASTRINPFGDNAISRGIKKGEDLFEKPLFERALPALKFKGFKEVYGKLIAGGMEDSAAMKKASETANIFYGGINKSIRNKNGQDLARIIALAPDWLESRARLALNEWKGTAKTVVGKGNNVDKLYAKSFARGAAKTGALIGASAYLGNKSDRPQDVAALPAGSTSTGRERNVDLIGTSDEGNRLPVQAVLRAIQGNPLDLIDLEGKNKLSGLARAMGNVVLNSDAFGHPIRGNDEYGKHIPAGVQLAKHANEVSKPFQPQTLQALIALAQGYGSPEEIATQGAELPLRYNSPSKKGQMRIRKF